MTVRPEVIDELRSLFKEGATPSRLMRQIAERHADEPDQYGLIQEYFLEAFAVPIVRGLKPQDDFRNTGMQYAFLNHHLLHELAVRRSEWDAEHDRDSQWLDGAAVTDHETRVSSLERPALPELRRIWSDLTADERAAVLRASATSAGHLETVKLLARLAERLQSRVNELEAAVEPALAAHH